MDARYSYYRLRAWAVIGGVTVPLVRFQLTFGLNAIPEAIMSLPLGREFGSVAASPVHQIVTNLGEMQPVEIWLNAALHSQTDDTVPGLGIPSDDFKVFDGFTAAPGYTRSWNEASYQLTAKHWLVQLNLASALGKSFHPASPATYTTAAVLPATSSAGAGSFTAIGDGLAFLTPDRITQDLWGAALLPWFQELTKRDPFLLWDPIATRLIEGEGNNPLALAALALMAPGADPTYPPLALDVPTRGNSEIPLSIATAIATAAHYPEFAANQTLWDLLTGVLAPEYLFAVVPRVNSAMVVPYIAGYRGQDGAAYGAIRTTDYATSQILGDLPSTLRAFGVLSSLGSQYGAARTLAGMQPSLGGIGGLFDTGREGNFLLQPGPAWSANLVAATRAAPATTGANGKATSTAIAPRKGRAAAASAAAASPAEDNRDFLNRYAQARYVSESLRGREGMLSGALRFDIAPGSTVLIETGGEPFVDGDQLSIPFIGTALQVTIAVDAEAPMAGTAFHFAELRSVLENEDDANSVPRHPLYTATFWGAPLL